MPKKYCFKRFSVSYFRDEQEMIETISTLHSTLALFGGMLLPHTIRSREPSMSPYTHSIIKFIQMLENKKETCPMSRSQ